MLERLRGTHVATKPANKHGRAAPPCGCHCASSPQVYKDIAHCQDASAFSNHTKRICPTGTAYVNDNDALLVCDANPDYTITFCGLL